MNKKKCRDTLCIFNEATLFINGLVATGTIKISLKRSQPMYREDEKKSIAAEAIFS